MTRNVQIRIKIIREREGCFIYYYSEKDRYFNIYKKKLLEMVGEIRTAHALKYFSTF